MPRLIQAGEFFVVGGPVQPDRPCYIERGGDEDLCQAVREQRFCYLLGPRAMGKSSLMARAIRTLRGAGQLAAVVDLNQIGARGESAEPGRWYYSIAYRILRELRLKVDLQSWWQEKSALMSEQRLAEFFWEIVLTNTTVPVTVFFDEIERAAELPFSQELFAAIRACYTGRATEPDYARLNFVVLGVAYPAQLCPDPSVSPFDAGQPIELEEFTLEQTQQLAAGFEGGSEQASALLRRIYAWTQGQPYLTQKIARGVVRRGGKLEDVGRVVREQFVAPGATQEEPLLNHIRTVLTGGAPHARQALTLLGKISKGAQIFEERGSRAQELLRLAGVVTLDDQGRLQLRNRLYKSVFSSRWVNSASPFDWRGFATAAAVMAAAVLIPLWYTQYLPRPYVETLSVVTQDFAVAEDAYRKLHRLPGFAGTADRLLAQVMVRRSRQADSFAEVQAADASLRRLPEGQALADQLMSEYWLGRAVEAVRAERRDEALLLATRALEGSNDTAARAIASELIGEDYARLERSFRLTAPPAHWEVDWPRRVLTLVDQAHRAERLPLAAALGDTAPPPARLTAQQHVPINRELSVDETGSAGAFTLELTVEHPAVAQLMVTLEAPSGVRAGLALSARADGAPTHALRASGRSPLAVLADEQRQGVWRLSLVDREAGATGTLVRWGLQFPGAAQPRRDEPEQGVAVPDPVRTEQVALELSPDGRWAAAAPAREAAVGAIAVWDVAGVRLAADLQMRAAPDFLAFTPDGARLVIVTGDELGLWDVSTGGLVAELATQTEFLLPPAVGVAGDYIALAERVDASAAPLFSLVRAADGELVASVEGLAETRDWALGPQARYLALLGPARLVRIVDPRRGTLLSELRHQRDVVRLLPLPTDDWLVTVDSAGDIYAWGLEAGEGGSSAEPSRRRLGMTVSAASVSVAADASTIAFEARQGHVVARGLSGERAPLNLRIDRTGAPIGTRLAPDGRTLLTASGAVLQRWRLGEVELGAGVDPDLSALALDEAGRVVALGFRGGHVRVRSASQLDAASPAGRRVDFIGHQGAVTALALDAQLGLIVSGGSDGVVRLWDLASAAPTEDFMRHPTGPVQAVTLSGDGRWIASAAEYSARVWRVSGGALSGETPVNGTALAVDFAPSSALLAVGDNAGNLFFAAPTSAAPLRSSRAQGSIRSVAFAPDGNLLASGDEAGYVQLWDPVTAGRVGTAQVFPHPVRWVGFSDDGRFLVAQTDHWLHRLAVSSRGLTVVTSHLLDVGLEAGAALAAPRGDRLRLVGGRGLGRPAFYELDLSRPAGVVLAPGSPLLSRDWEDILGLTIDPSGSVVPL